MDTLHREDLYLSVKSYQTERLRTTYADFAAQEEWKDVCWFFFERVYNTEDTRTRDAGMQRLHHHLDRFLGGDVVRCLGAIIKLQQLTIQLDLKLVADLRILQAPVTFDLIQYEQAYRMGNNYQARIDQIEVLVDALQQGFRLFQRFGIGAALKALHRFQKLRGDALVTGFLVEAHDILTELNEITPLVQAIETRERERLDRIYQFG
ncbi:MAG: hypothetical protein KDC35_14300 [Acidobacteria bacterium]|nr:hypothetical protein [Acidobacteriota bacterium]